MIRAIQGTRSLTAIIKMLSLMTFDALFAVHMFRDSLFADHVSAVHLSQASVFLLITGDTQPLFTARIVGDGFTLAHNMRLYGQG